MCSRCDTLEHDLTVEVLLAEAEQALILAQTDAGESVAGAIRPLSPAEKRAKMRFSEIERLEQAAADEAAKLLASNAQVYIRAVIGEIFGAADDVAPGQVVDAIEQVNRAQPKTVTAETERAKSAMSTILGQVYTGASLIVTGEARRQGVKKTPKPLTAAPGQFDDLAKAVALHPWTRLTGKLQADMLEPRTLAKPTVAKTDVETSLQAIPLDGAEDLARQTIHAAHGAGRIETAKTMQPEEIYATELLDGATCPACYEVDGKDYATIEEGEAEYETGGYGACRGGARCRGTLVFQYNALGIDAPPPPRPAPGPLPAPEPTPPAPAPKTPAADTPWAKTVADAKAQLPADPSKLGYREELPDLKKLVAEERARIIADAGGDLPELKKQHAEIKAKLEDWDALSQGLGYYPPSKWPAELLPLARKHGLSRKSPKTARQFLADGRYDLWEMEMNAGSKVAQLERALDGAEDYVKRWKMPKKPITVDDVLPDGRLGAETEKALTAVLDAGEALDEQLQTRVAKRVKDLGPDPRIEYDKNHDEVRRLTTLRATTPDDAEFARLGKQIDSLYADAAAFHAPMKEYDRNKSAVMREEVLSLLADVRAVGGGGRSTYTKGATWNKEVDDAMTFAHTLYPDDWNDHIAAKFPTVELSEVKRGYNDRGREITLSRDSFHKGSGDFGHVAVHELGHSMELAVPGLSNLEWAFHHHRSDKIRRVDGTVELKPPKDMYGTGTELSYDDKWATDYTGKTYRRQGEAGALSQWEIFQTGVESLFEGSQYFTRSGSLGDDAEFRRFILGVLSVL